MTEFHDKVAIHFVVIQNGDVLIPALFEFWMVVQAAIARRFRWRLNTLTQRDHVEGELTDLNGSAAERKRSVDRSMGRQGEAYSMGTFRCNDQFTGRCAIPSERETLAKRGKLNALYIDRLIESVA